MKRQIFILVLIVVLVNSSCDKKGFADPYNSHDLTLFFQDASGKDLVEGIELDLDKITHDLSLSYGGPVHPDLYTLRSEYPNQCKSPFTVENPLLLMTGRAKFNDNRNCVSFLLSSEKENDCSTEIGRITIWMTCPHIFSDDKEHVIETLWEDYTYNSVIYKKCISVIVDGKHFSASLVKFSEESDFKASVATIIL